MAALTRAMDPGSRDVFQLEAQPDLDPIRGEPAFRRWSSG